MKSYSVIVSLMAAFAVGAPLEATNSNATVSNSNGTDTEIVPQAFTRFRCRNSQGAITFNKDTVFANVQNFPDRETPGLSGYPHEFENTQGFPWDFNKWQCGNYEPLLEMPVFPDGHLYRWNVKRDAPNGEAPGPARAIYTATGVIQFCGLIAHTTGSQGYFDKCEEI